MNNKNYELNDENLEQVNGGAGFVGSFVKETPIGITPVFEKEQVLVDNIAAVRPGAGLNPVGDNIAAVKPGVGLNPVGDNIAAVKPGVGLNPVGDNIAAVKPVVGLNPVGDLDA